MTKYHETKDKKGILDLINENKDLWAIGELSWNADTYLYILENGVKPGLPGVFFQKDATMLGTYLDSLCELYLFNSEVQFHLLRSKDGNFLFARNDLKLGSDTETHSFETIASEKDSRYRFADSLGVFNGVDESVKYLACKNKRIWRLYHV